MKLLSRLQSLESWDLSGNRLEELPQGLALPSLRSLDLSDNEMEDVTTLDSLTGLEELKLDGNIYITVRNGLIKENKGKRGYCSRICYRLCVVLCCAIYRTFY